MSLILYKQNSDMGCSPCLSVMKGPTLFFAIQRLKACYNEERNAHSAWLPSTCVTQGNMESGVSCEGCITASVHPPHNSVRSGLE